MKRASLMILLLVVILVFPALLFAQDNWSKLSGVVDDFSRSVGVGAVSGRISTGLNNGVGWIKSSAGGAVGWATGNSALGAQVSSANWRQAISTNYLGVTKTVLGAAAGAVTLNPQFGNAIATTDWSNTVDGYVGAVKTIRYDTYMNLNPIKSAGDAGRGAYMRVTDPNTSVPRPGRFGGNITGF